MDNNYLSILDYIKKYGGEKYKMLEKCKSEDERVFMEHGSTAGKQARLFFTEIVNTVASRFDLLVARIIQWQNSGNFVNYFWGQLKREIYKDSNISVSTCFFI